MQTVDSYKNLTRSAIVQDRSRLFGEGMCLLIEANMGIRVAYAATLEDVEEVISRESEVEVVVLEMSGVPWDPAEYVAGLHRASDPMRIVGTYAGRYARRRHIEGVTYVSRSAPSQVLVWAMQGRVSGIYAGSRPYKEDAPRQADSLSRREFQVLALISAGMTTGQIAERLGISVKTVEGKRQALFTKLGVQSQSAAVSVAIRSGLLGPGMSNSGDTAAR